MGFNICNKKMFEYVWLVPGIGTTKKSLFIAKMSDPSNIMLVNPLSLYQYNPYQHILYTVQQGLVPYYSPVEYQTQRVLQQLSERQSSKESIVQRESLASTSLSLENTSLVLPLALAHLLQCYSDCNAMSLKMQNCPYGFQDG